MSMRETIILAPGLNGNELMEMMARRGVSSIDMRICGAGELARISLMRSGISINENILGPDEEMVAVAKAIKDIDYFGSASFTDIGEIRKVINIMRSLVCDGDEEKGISDTLIGGLFAEKNTALIAAYKNYKSVLSDMKAIDLTGVIKKAIENCSPIDADFLTFEEIPLGAVEKKLLDKLSGGNYRRIPISDLFGAGRAAYEKSIYHNCYGASNEVQNIIADIYRGKSPDRCTVAVTDTDTYSQLFFDIALTAGIPMTFGCGIPIINSNPAKLLSYYHRWRAKGFFGAGALMDLLKSDCFDKSGLYETFPKDDENFKTGTFFDILSGLRFTDNRELNLERIENYKKALDETDRDTALYKAKSKCLPALLYMADALSLPAQDFVRKFSKIRKGSENSSQSLIMNLDLAAASAIYGELKTIHESGYPADDSDLIGIVLKKKVCVQKCEPGKLHVTGITGAFSAIRDDLYIAGMSASNYPGAPRENYLLLDDDLRRFGEGAEYLLSDNRIMRKRTDFLNLCRTAKALSAKIHVSFSGLDVSLLKTDAPSTLLYELYRSEVENNDSTENYEKIFIKTGYFDPPVTLTGKVGQAYNNGMDIRQAMSDVSVSTEDAKEKIIPMPTKGYSPTALDTFFSCPRRFMLRYIVGISEPEDDDPFEVISAAGVGVLAHALMEDLSDSDMTEDEFLGLAGTRFDSYILENPPLIEAKADAEKSRFAEMMQTAYRMDPKRRVVLSEEDIECIHESGVKIHGFPDRVEKLDDGTHLIVDFKTGRRVKHASDDIDTCLQVLIYAYLMEKKGYKISGCEYRYLRLGTTVSCRYDDEMKGKLNERIRAFKDGLLKGDFPTADKAETGDMDACSYCKFGSICGKTYPEGGDE